MLLAARDEDGSRMTDKQLRDESITLFLAGHETTANTLSWTWWLLAQNPGAEKKLHAELDSVLAGRAPTLEDVAKLKYAEDVLTESLRLYPPAWGWHAWPSRSTKSRIQSAKGNGHFDSAVDDASRSAMV